MAPKKKYGRPTHAVITVPDPDNSLPTAHAEAGSMVEWRCETPNYPSFDIIFDGENPFNNTKAKYKAKGTINHPAVRKVKKQIKTEQPYQYTIHHHPADGGADVVTGPGNITFHQCTVCPPAPTKG